MVGSDVLAGMTAQFYRQYFRRDKMIMRHDSVFVMVESLNGDDSGSKSLEKPDLDDVRQYTATTDELLVITVAASNFVNNANRKTTIHAFLFYTRV